MKSQIITLKSEIYSTPRRLLYKIDGVFETILRLLGVFVGGVRFVVTGKGSDTFTNMYNRIHNNGIIKKYLKKDKFDFNGLYFPGFRNNKAYQGGLVSMSYNDILLPHIVSKGKYNSKIVKRLQYIGDGPYMYQDDTVDFMIKKGDVVIDAGAWIGCFSVVASSFGAISYAFEPAKETFEHLKETAQLNSSLPGKIIPINKGVGDKKEKIGFEDGLDGNGGNKINTKITDNMIELISIDEFVKENNIPKIDFIKSDIEGYERQLLEGAKDSIKKYSPKLSISTYHFSDDPEVLEKMILKINHKYNIIHMHKKLFAYIPGKHTK
ncbi:MAG: FkbM family methyltransferase [Candidatus Absconditabacterales bacterium]